MTVTDKIKELAEASLVRMDKAMADPNEVMSVTAMSYETGYVSALNHLIDYLRNEEERETESA